MAFQHISCRFPLRFLIGFSAPPSSRPVTKQQLISFSLSVLCLFLAVAVVWVWRERARLFAPEAPLAPGELAYSRTMLWKAGAGLAITIALVGFLINLPREKASLTWALGGLALLIAAHSIYYIVIYGRNRHIFSEESISLRHGRRGSKYLRWAELQSVGYRLNKECFHLVDRTGTEGFVSANLRGVDQFALTVLRRAPSEAIDEVTRLALGATADGKVPRARRFADASGGGDWDASHDGGGDGGGGDG